MKKIFTLLFLLTVSMSILFATQISAVGYGKTQSEATENARIELAKQIFPTFIVTETKTASSQSGTVSESSFSSGSESIQFGSLSQIKYETDLHASGQYAVTAYIKDDTITLNYYSRYLRDAATNAQYFYSIIQDINQNSENNEKPYTQMVDYYADVLNYYLQYDSYVQILYALEHPELVHSLEVIPGKTYRILCNEYNSVLIEYDNLLRSGEYANDTEFSLIHILNRNTRKLEQLKEQKKQTLTIEQAEREALVSSRIKELTEKNLNKNDSSNYDKTSDFYNDYLRLIDDINNFNQTYKSYENLISQESKRMDNELEQEIKEINNRPYRLGQLDKNSNPLRQYVLERQREIIDLKQQVETEKQEIISYIETTMKPIIQNQYSAVTEDLNKISESKYTVSSTNRNLKSELISQGTVNNDYEWSFKVSPDLPSNIRPEGQLNIRLSELTDNSKDTSTKAYLDDVDYYNALLTDHFTEYFNIQIDYSVDIKDLNNLIISFEKISFTSYVNRSTGNSGIVKSFRTYDFKVHTESIEFPDLSALKWLNTDSRIKNSDTNKNPEITAVKNNTSQYQEPSFSPYTNTKTTDTTNPETAYTPESFDDYLYGESPFLFTFYVGATYNMPPEKTKNYELAGELGIKIETKYVSCSLGAFLGFGKENSDTISGMNAAIEFPVSSRKKAISETKFTVGVEAGLFFPYKDKKTTLYVKPMIGAKYRYGSTAVGVDIRPSAENPILLTFKQTVSLDWILH